MTHVSSKHGDKIKTGESFNRAKVPASEVVACSLKRLAMSGHSGVFVPNQLD